MKNIANILGRGNLTAHERFILLIQNDVHRGKTGKDILTPADKAALEHWRAANNDEAREWNRLNEGWKHTGRMDIEVEFIYKDAQAAYLAQLPIIIHLLYYQSYREMGGCIKTLKDLKKVTLEEAGRIAAKQREAKLKSGLDFDYAVYQLAFERLSAEDKGQMKKLYADVEFDHQYLDQEEVIANLYNGKNELTQKAKEKLSALVAEWSYNKFAKEYQLFHYFACIPIIEVAKQFLISKGIKIGGKPFAENQEADDEDISTSEDVTKAMAAYAAEHATTVQTLLQEGCLKALDGGLLDAYMPLAVSNEAELLQRWITTKAEAKATLRRHVDVGELTVRKRTGDETMKDKLYSKRLYDIELEVAREVMETIGLEIAHKGELDEKMVFETFEGSLITGESLCAFKENYEFVKGFKKRIDEYEPNLGVVYADDDLEQKGDHLDQEFIICGLTDDGEASIFSRYGMATNLLSGFFERKVFFEEVSEDSKKFLKFKDADIECIFKERRENLISGYAELIAFEAVFKKASKVYEADLAHHVTDRIKILRDYIEKNNEAIRVATNHGDNKYQKAQPFRRKDTLQMKEDLIIDADAIRPAEKTIEEHESKLRAILGSF